jgi:hypothetical protein
MRRIIPVLTLCLMFILSGCSVSLPFNKVVFTTGFEKDEVFRRSVETHFQRGYTLEEMRQFVEKAGLSFIEAIDADTHKGPDDNSERIYIIARENGKRI